MRILSLDRRPITALPYFNAAPRGGTVRAELPILTAKVDALPGALTALLVASDLQGVAPSRARQGALALLGEVLAEQLDELSAALDLPPPGQVGILLAGDLYAAPAGDVRGASGDVRGVWQALAARCRFVAGVAGNHDLFGPPQEVERWGSRSGAEKLDRRAASQAAQRFARQAGVHLLDGQVVSAGGLRIGGVGGIIGNTRKPNRRDTADFCALLGQVLDVAPDVLVLHEGPDEPASQRRGNPDIRGLIEVTERPPLVLCGHCYWDDPLATLAGGAQVLNADSRVIVLRA